MLRAASLSLFILAASGCATASGAVGHGGWGTPCVAGDYREFDFRSRRYRHPPLPAACTPERKVAAAAQCTLFVVQAPGCTGCRNQLGAMARRGKEFRQRGVDIQTAIVETDHCAEALQSAHRAPTWPLGRLDARRARKTWGFRAAPMTYAIRNGRVLRVWLGETPVGTLTAACDGGANR